jgi:hypothetical protein
VTKNNQTNNFGQSIPAFYHYALNFHCRHAILEEKSFENDTFFQQLLHCPQNPIGLKIYELKMLYTKFEKNWTGQTITRKLRVFNYERMTKDVTRT